MSVSDCIYMCDYCCLIISNFMKNLELYSEILIICVKTRVVVMWFWGKRSAGFALNVLLQFSLMFYNQ